MEIIVLGAEGGRRDISEDMSKIEMRKEIEKKQHTTRWRIQNG